MNNLRIGILLLLLALSVTVRAEPANMIVTPLHRPAAELVTTLQTLYPDAQIAVADGALAIRAEAAQLPRIEQLLAELDKPVARYLVTLSNSNTPAARSYSTQSVGDVTANRFVIGTAQALRVARQQTQTELKAAGPLWVALDEKVVAGEWLSLQLSATAEQVSVQIRWQVMASGRQTQYDNTVTGRLGEWLPLQQTANDPEARHWQTQTADALPRFIKIDKAP